MTAHNAVNLIETSFPCADGFSMPALVMIPESPRPAPALLFISEPFGLNPEMRRVAREFAEHGYVVMLPDLLSRGPWFSCVRALMRDLQNEAGRGVEDLLAARAWLGHQSFVDPERVGVLGLCMGGGYALLLARTGLFRVSAPFYGRAPSNLNGACPIVASYGGRDRVFRPHAEKLEAELARLGIAHEVKVYDGAGHSFMTRPPNRLLAAIGPLTPARAGYHPEAASDATARVVRFLKDHL